MAQLSLPWTDNGIGDGHAYTDAEWWEIYKSLMARRGDNTGVMRGSRSEFFASGVASPITVQPGSCVVDGTFHDSDANENIVVPVPALATRIDRIVARKDFTAQEVRLYLLQGVEGGPVPTLQHLPGNLWDLPLWQISTTTGGVITFVADEREFAQYSTDLAYPLVLPGGRLTPVSGVPFDDSTSGFATIYYYPWKSNRIPLYDDSAKWRLVEFTETSLSLAGLAASTLFDIFAYRGVGGLTLETLAWASSGAGTSTRATGLAYQDGYKVLSGDPTRLYLGTFKTTAAIGQCNDNVSSRLLYNMYNKVQRRLYANVVAGASGIIKTTNVWEPFFGNTTVGEGRVEFVLGLQEGDCVAVEDLSYVFTGAYAGSGNPVGSLGIGLNATTADSCDSRNGATITSSPSTVYGTLVARAKYYPVAGYNYIQRIFIGGGGGTTYFYADASPTNAAHHKNNLTGELYQ